KPQTRRLQGNVERQQVRISSRAGGRVGRVAVAEGERVEPGRALVYLEVPELEAQHDQYAARLKAAQAELERLRNGARPAEKAAAKAAVDAALARYEKLKNGPRDTDIEHARGALASAEAALRRHRQDLERVRSLYPRGSSDAEYDAARAAYAPAEGDVR